MAAAAQHISSGAAIRFCGAAIQFSATMFLSAALLFAVQPLLGKMLLPLAGGAPSVWLSALAFFQTALLLGYLLAHLLSRLSAQRQALVTLLLLLAGLVWAPPHLPAAMAGQTAGSAGQVLLLLAETILLPYLALSTVSVGLQRLYATSPGNSRSSSAQDGSANAPRSSSPEGGSANTPRSSSPEGGSANTPRSSSPEGGSVNTPRSSSPKGGSANTPRSSSPKGGSANTPRSSSPKGGSANNERGDPYFLYAASNAGSFAGLLAYPFLLEPFLALPQQSLLWTAGYVLLIAMTGVLLLQTAPQRLAPAVEAKRPTSAIAWNRRLYWLALAFVPSSLSMGLTALITEDYGSLPMFWVLPLSLYLLSFVIAFARRRRYRAESLGFAHFVLAAFVICLFGASSGDTMLSAALILPLTAAFFVAALWCNSRLADLRPGTASLSEYYLWLALGGALGGVFNAFIAPAIFPQAIEFVLVMCLSLLLQPWDKLKIDVSSQNRLNASAALSRGGRAVVAIQGNVLQTLAFFAPGLRRSARNDGTGQADLVSRLAWSLGLLALAVLIAITPDTDAAKLEFLQKALLIAGVMLAAYLRQLMAFLGLAFLALALFGAGARHAMDTKRDFFGVLKIAERANENGDVWRSIVHGSTVHGTQRVTPPSDLSIASYYATMEPVFAAFNPKEVGLMGLGAGVMLCMRAPGRHFTVYEIDPLVRNMAMRWFTYIRECGEPAWRIGDGRLALQADADAKFDMLVIDVFSSDFIPAHLLTREALSLYLSRLKPDGFIAFNISNRYYDLGKPLAAIAADLHAQAWAVQDLAADAKTGKEQAFWVIVAPEGRDLRRLEDLKWSRMSKPAFPVWTDDFANLLAVLSLR